MAEFVAKGNDFDLRGLREAWMAQLVWEATKSSPLVTYSVNVLYIYNIVLDQYTLVRFVIQPFIFLKEITRVGFCTHVLIPFFGCTQGWCISCISGSHFTVFIPFP